MVVETEKCSNDSTSRARLENPSRSALRRRFIPISNLAPGLSVAILVALAAQFISDHYGAPVMLMALLFGMVLNFLSEDGPCRDGIGFASSSLLRIGVALLGFRVSLGMVAELGWSVVALVVIAVILTICSGIILARFFGHNWRFGVLSGGAVAICGASAAVAIAAVLPKDERSDEQLVFTVASVTILSTVAMILYPVLATFFELGARDTSVFIGVSIHDVAQVVGAGFSVSPEVGETATLVKLMRVAMLAPVLIAIALLTRNRGETEGDAGQRPPLLPWFFVCFLLASGIASLEILPVVISELAGTLSKWALVVAIAAVGLKTSIGKIASVGRGAALLVLSETLLLGVGVLFVVWSL